MTEDKIRVVIRRRIKRLLQTYEYIVCTDQRKARGMHTGISMEEQFWIDEIQCKIKELEKVLELRQPKPIQFYSHVLHRLSA